MSIRVTCPGCHTRFNVSDKFAGKTGPCPKCKKSIKVPDASEQVKVHEPEHFGPKGATGTAVLKPVFRKEASVSPVQITIIVAAVIAYFAVALILRLLVTDKAAFSDIIEFLLGALLSLPLVFAGYTFLRDSELAPMRGQDLWTRLGICSAVYALTWLAMPLAAYMFDDWNAPTWIAAFIVMIAIGAAAASMMLEFDFLTGVIHYGLYLVACLLGRFISGLGVFPGMLQESSSPLDPSNPPPVEVGDGGVEGSALLIQQFCELCLCLVNG